MEITCPRSQVQSGRAGTHAQGFPILLSEFFSHTEQYLTAYTLQCTPKEQALNQNWWGK